VIGIDMGLQAGSQPPPSFTLAVPFYGYHTSRFVKSGGDKIDAPDINMFFVGLGGTFVTNVKLLGGNYGPTIRKFNG